MNKMNTSVKSFSDCSIFMSQPSDWHDVYMLSLLLHWIRTYRINDSTLLQLLVHVVTISSFNFLLNKEKKKLIIMMIVLYGFINEIISFCSSHKLNCIQYYILPLCLINDNFTGFFLFKRFGSKIVERNAVKFKNKTKTKTNNSSSSSIPVRRHQRQPQPHQYRWLHHRRRQVFLLSQQLTNSNTKAIEKYISFFKALPRFVPFQWLKLRKKHQLHRHQIAAQIGMLKSYLFKFWF